MAETGSTIIIIKKKKGGHGGHHGGAWKVAYADFVTAMMSLFIVLWLLSADNAVKNSVASYFRDPKGTSSKLGSAKDGVGHALPLHKEDLGDLKKRLQEAAKLLPNFDKFGKQVEITAAPDGLRIELLEDDGGTFFELGSAQPTQVMNEFLTSVSKELGKVPNTISVEGHTDAVPYSGDSAYSNWELSADRANAARRIMQTSGVGVAQIAEVRGFADQQLRVPDRPKDASNRRITLIVHAEGLVATPEGKQADHAGTEAKSIPTPSKQNDAEEKHAD